MEIFKEPYCYFFLLAKLFSFLSLRDARSGINHGTVFTRELKTSIGVFGSTCCYIFLVIISIWGYNWYDGLTLLLVSVITSIVPIPDRLGAILAPFLMPVFASLMYLDFYNVELIWSITIAIIILIITVIRFKLALKKHINNK